MGTYMAVWLAFVLYAVLGIACMWIANGVMSFIVYFMTNKPWMLTYAFLAKWMCAPVMLMDFDHFKADSFGIFEKNNLSAAAAGHVILSSLVWSQLATLVFLNIIPASIVITIVVSVMAVKYTVYYFELFGRTRT